MHLLFSFQVGGIQSAKSVLEGLWIDEGGFGEDLRWVGCEEVCESRVHSAAGVDDDFMSRLIETLERGSIPAVYDIECTYTSITEVGVECLLAFLSDNPYSQLSLVDCSCVNLSRSVRDEYKERIKRDFGDLIHVFLFCVCSKHGRYRGSECETTDRLSAVFFSHGFFPS